MTDGAVGRFDIYQNSDVSVTVFGLCIFSVPMLHVNLDGVRSGVGRCISRSRSL